MMLASCVRLAPFQMKRSTRLPSSERLAQNAGVQSGRALRPVQEHMWSRRKVRMEGDAEQAAFRAVIDRKVEHSCLLIALYADHAAGLFLQHEHIVRSDERERGWYFDPVATVRSSRLRSTSVGAAALTSGRWSKVSAQKTPTVRRSRSCSAMFVVTSHTPFGMSRVQGGGPSDDAFLIEIPENLKGQSYWWRNRITAAASASSSADLLLSMEVGGSERTGLAARPSL